MKRTYIFFIIQYLAFRLLSVFVQMLFYQLLTEMTRYYAYGNVQVFKQMFFLYVQNVKQELYICQG